MLCVVFAMKFVSFFISRSPLIEQMETRKSGVSLEHSVFYCIQWYLEFKGNPYLEFELIN